MKFKCLNCKYIFNPDRLKKPKFKFIAVLTLALICPKCGKSCSFKKHGGK